MIGKIILAQTNFTPVGDDTRVKVPNPFFGGPGPAGAGTAGGLVLSIISVLLLVVGSLAVIYLIIGGYRYITAHGNEEAAEGAKKTIQHAIMGLVVTILAFAIITIIANVLVGGRRGIF